MVHTNERKEKVVMCGKQCCVLLYYNKFEKQSKSLIIYVNILITRSIMWRLKRFEDQFDEIKIMTDTI